MIKRFLGTCGLLGMFGFVGICSAAFSVPANDGYVTDLAGILTSEQESVIEEDLLQYKQATSNEIAVVILQDLSGYAIEDAGLEIGRKWGIGSAGKNNGILLLIDYEGHAVRIDVGYGLEGAVPDIVAKGIIDTDIVPNFRNGRYGEGIASAVTSLQKHIGGEYSAERYAENEGENPIPGFIFLIIFVLLQWLIAILGRTKSWWLGGVFGGAGGLLLTLLFGWWLSIPLLIPLGLLLDYVVSSNYHRRGGTRWWAGGGWGPGGRGFGGGSGFGGFGGGGFGGGGAGSKW